jgi:hypothetical protein
LNVVKAPFTALNVVKEAFTTPELSTGGEVGVLRGGGGVVLWVGVERNVGR